MPSSYHGFLSEVTDLFLECHPRTVLDVGVGFGKWGMLFREYADVFLGRPKRHEWQAMIVGVEIFADYIQEHQRAIYSDIIIGDIAKLAPVLPCFDFGYAGDVIEHLPKEIALQTLEILRRKCGRFVVCIPLGTDWIQGENFGNPAEAHKSIWTGRDFEEWPIRIIKQNPKGKWIGVFSSC